MVVPTKKVTKTSLDYMYVGHGQQTSDALLLLALAQRDDIDHLWYAPVALEEHAPSTVNMEHFCDERDTIPFLRATDIKPFLREIMATAENAIEQDALEQKITEYISSGDRKYQQINATDYCGAIYSALSHPDSDKAFGKNFCKAWFVNAPELKHNINDKGYLINLYNAFARQIEGKHSDAQEDMQLFLPSEVVHDHDAIRKWMKTQHCTEAILKPRNESGGLNIHKLTLEDDHLGFETDPLPISKRYFDLSHQLDPMILAKGNVPKIIAENQEIQEIESGGKPIYDMLTALIKFSLEHDLEEGMVLQPCLDVSKGDLRIVIAGGKVIGAYNRMPEISDDGEVAMLANVNASGTRAFPKYARGWNPDMSQHDLGFSDMLRLDALAKMLQDAPYNQNYVMLDMMADHNGRRYVTELNSSYVHSLTHCRKPGETEPMDGTQMKPAHDAASAIIDAYKLQHLQLPAKQISA